jgi:DUF1009 family protein
MEGSDAVIARAGEITCGRPFVVVKAAKPNQDMRFDVPVIGVATIDAMRSAGATGIHVTRNKTLLFDKQQIVELADQSGICLVSGD